MKKPGMVTAAGKMALLWVAFGAGLVLSVYIVIWLTIAGYGFEGLGLFFVWLVVSMALTFVEFHHLFGKSSGLAKGKPEEWVLVVTLLVGAFAAGAAFQNISTIGSQMVSTSTCVTPATVNVTSPNCNKIQTRTETEGPFVYMGQLGAWLVILGSMGALVFGIIYVVLRLQSSL